MSAEARYVLAKKIARGGMAEIYLGKHVGEDGFQRLCAIKRILPHYAQDQEFIQMFRDEAHICKRLQHANIVRVEGFEEVEGSYAIIMEFVDGADLRTLLHAVEQSKKKIPTPMACYIIAEAARGLHFAHTKVDEITQQPLGIVHRDISPQNLLLSYEGEIKVTDFGIADAESKLTETRPGIVKGKYSYMSPEQISAKAVDARTDVFALAIVLWEMLTMRRLFQGENEVDTIQRVKNCRIDHELRQLNPEIDDELDAIVKKALAKDVKKRFKSAGDFEKDLRRYMSKRFPEFTPEDLGNFLKKGLEAKRVESAAEIKKTLTETNLRAAPRRAEPSSTAGRQISIDLESPGASGPALSLARPAAGGALVPASPNATPSQPRVVSPASSISNFPGRPSHSGGVFGRNPQTRGTNALLPVARPGGSTSPKLVLVALLSVALLVAGAKLAIDLASQSGRVAQVTLRSQPSRVKVDIGGKPLNNGRWVRASSRTPLRLNLKAGEHELLITRPGYKPYKWRFDLAPGQRLTRDDVVLEKTRPTAAVRIKARGADGIVKVDIDDGYYVAQLIPGKIAAVNPDLFAGTRYTMRVSTTAGSFTCQVTARSTNWRRPNEVIADVKRRQCTMTGP